MADLKETLINRTVHGVVKKEDRQYIEGLQCLPNILGCKYGCDPELFIAGAGGTVGSEAIIPAGGIQVHRKKEYSNPHDDGKIARDGVQVELHPTAYSCRAYISNSLTALFRALDAELKANKMSANFSQVINLTDAELAALSEQARQLGCMPSHNVYGKPSLNVNGAIVKQRSAAGHIHFGSHVLTPSHPDPVKAENLVRICDVLLGNTAVLIDRDPGAAERRKLYGRAGEHRTPSHGVEYRTLSNFWLRGYPIMSLMFGIAHTAFNVASINQARVQDSESRNYHGTYLQSFTMDTLKPTGENSPNILWNADQVLMENVDFQRIERAINENNFDLALENYNEWVRPFFMKVYTNKGLAANRLVHFDHFVKRIQEHGIEYWFPQDPMTHWCEKGDGHNKGWESFCATVIAADILKEKGIDTKGITPYGEMPPDSSGFAVNPSTATPTLIITKPGSKVTLAPTYGTGGQIV